MSNDIYNNSHENKYSNFFVIQVYRKKLSWLFFALFSLVVFIHLLVLLVIVLILANLFDVFAWSLWLIFSGLFFALLIIGSFIRSQLLTNSGQKLALTMGGVRLFIDKTDNHSNNQWVDNGQLNHSNHSTAQFFKTFIRAKSIQELPSGYGRLYEFCEQMSIASGIAMPMLYVLPAEKGVNACVAGHDDSLVLIVTQGAVDKLSNEQLYALIAHEFGHILHGDAKFNIRLSIMMAGLSLIYESADWLENKIFGDFNKDYHHNSQFNNVKDWLLAVNQPKIKFSYSPSLDNMPIGAYVLLGFLFVSLGIYRLIGFFGMASYRWLCRQFNHQRELLADATSVQLTRSYAIADLLKDMDNKFDGKLYSTQVAGFGFFFFADPNGKNNILSSHPDFKKRIHAINEQLFFKFGEGVTKHFDQYKLQSALDDVICHRDILPIDEELVQIKPIDIEYFDKDFDSGFETIVDGRLIVGQAFKEDFIDKKYTPSPSYIAINKTDSCDEFVAKKLSWQIEKHLKDPIGVIVVIECIILCDNANNDKLTLDNNKVSLNQVLAMDLPNNNIYHHIDNALLIDVAKLPQNHRQHLMIYALKYLKHRLKNPINQNDKTDSHLLKYHQNLLSLLDYYDEPAKQTHNKQTHNKQINNKLSFDKRYGWFIYANIWLFVIINLSNYFKMDNNELWQHLSNCCTKYNKTHACNQCNICQLISQNSVIKAAWITLFLVSLQGNYFLLNKADVILGLTDNSLRLMGINHHFDQNDIIKIHHLDMIDWLKLLLSVRLDTPLPIVYLKTWQSILHYDDIIDGREFVIDKLFAMNFT